MEQTWTPADHQAQPTRLKRLDQGRRPPGTDLISRRSRRELETGGPENSQRPVVRLPRAASAQVGGLTRRNEVGRWPHRFAFALARAIANGPSDLWPICIAKPGRRGVPLEGSMRRIEFGRRLEEASCRVSHELLNRWSQVRILSPAPNTNSNSSSRSRRPGWRSASVLS